MSWITLTAEGLINFFPTILYFRIKIHSNIILTDNFVLLLFTEIIFLSNFRFEIYKSQLIKYLEIPYINQNYVHIRVLL